MLPKHFCSVLEFVSEIYLITSMFCKPQIPKADIRNFWQEYVADRVTAYNDG